MLPSDLARPAQPAALEPPRRAAALLRVVDAAAGLELDDTPAVRQLQAQGQRVTARLVAAGDLPSHLLIELDDPPVVVLRTLATAARRLARR